MASIHRALTAGGAERVEALTEDHVSLTDELARAVRIASGTDLGLAVHVVPLGERPSENLGQGNTYMAVASARTIKNRAYNYAGSGRPDRTRISLSALDLVRRMLAEHT